LNRQLSNLTKLTAGLELPKPDSPIWQTRHSGFVREIYAKPIHYTSRYFINKGKL
jgi:hypothetical protein